MIETKTDHAETDSLQAHLLSVDDLRKLQEAAAQKAKSERISDLLLSAGLSMTFIAYMFHELTNIVLGVNAPWYADMLIGFLLPVKLYRLVLPLMVLRYLGLLTLPLVKMV